MPQDPSPQDVQRVHLATIVHLVREWLEHVHAERACPSLDARTLGELLAAVDDSAEVEGLRGYLDVRLRELGPAA